MLLLGAALCAACSYTFDGEAPDLPLIGEPPPTTSLPHLNAMPVISEQFVRSQDERVWLLMNQIDNSWRAVLLEPPGTVETFTGDQVIVGYHANYIIKKLTASDGGPISLTIRSVGEAGPGHVFNLPGGTISVDPDGNDKGFAFFHWDATETGYLLQQRDQSFSRTIPWPKGADPTNPYGETQFFWDGGANTGTTYYDRGKDGHIVGHRTRVNQDIDLGVRPKSHLWYGYYNPQLLTCGDDGLRRVPLDGVSPDIVVYPDKCTGMPFAQIKGMLYWTDGTLIKRVKNDGSAPPEVFTDLGSHRLLQLTGELQIVYSTDPAGRFIYNDGDGWLDNWRFMERGSAFQWSLDKKSMFWLEHSAQVSGAGELTMATIPNGQPLRLTRNTRGFAQIGDGQILADANHSFNGTHNRLVVIDVPKKVVRWVAQSANGWLFGPRGVHDIIVDVVSGATGHDVVRVVVPDPLK